MAANLLLASLSSVFAFSDQTKKRDREKPPQLHQEERERKRDEKMYKESPTRRDSLDLKSTEKTLEQQYLLYENLNVIKKLYLNFKPIDSSLKFPRCYIMKAVKFQNSTNTGSYKF